MGSKTYIFSVLFISQSFRTVTIINPLLSNIFRPHKTLRAHTAKNTGIQGWICKHYAIVGRELVGICIKNL